MRWSLRTYLTSAYELRYFLILPPQGIDSDIEEVTRPGDNNSDPMLENHLEENGNDLPPIEDITTIPEEASEELREEEEAAALEAALRTPDGGTISTEIEKPSTATIMQG